MNNRDALNIMAGTDAEKKRTLTKYVDKDLRYQPKDKDPNGKFVVKLKNGLYYNGNTFVANKFDALIYNNYNDAKEVIKLFNAKIVKI